MKNYLQPGTTITVTSPAIVLSGDGVVVGAFFGVAAYDAASGEDLEIDLEGVFSLPKVTTDVIAQGDKLYWDNTAKKLTKTAGTGGKILAGVARVAAGNGVTTVEVRLMATAQAGPA